MPGLSLSNLTVAERRIVSVVATGVKNDEVAEALGLSPKTVEWTLTRIYRKLGVRSRAELIARLAGIEPDKGRGVPASRARDGNEGIRR